MLGICRLIGDRVGLGCGCKYGDKHGVVNGLCDFCWGGVFVALDLGGYEQIVKISKRIFLPKS